MESSSFFIPLISLSNCLHASLESMEIFASTGVVCLVGFTATGDVCLTLTAVCFLLDAATFLFDAANLALVSANFLLDSTTSLFDAMTFEELSTELLEPNADNLLSKTLTIGADILLAREVIVDSDITPPVLSEACLAPSFISLVI